MLEILDIVKILTFLRFDNINPDIKLNIRIIDNNTFVVIILSNKSKFNIKNISFVFSKLNSNGAIIIDDPLIRNNMSFLIPLILILNTVSSFPK